MDASGRQQGGQVQGTTDGELAPPPAGAPVEAAPFSWRPSPGVLYAEAPLRACSRPPLLAPWECRRVAEFDDPGARRRWLATRSVGKALVREQLKLPGIVDLRESVSGAPLLFLGGLPATGLWLDLECRAGRAAGVVAEVPAGLRMCHVTPAARAVAERLVRRSERRALRRVVGGDDDLALVAGWAAKEAALRAVRAPSADPATLAGVAIGDDLAVRVGSVRLHLVGLRLSEELVVAVVAQPVPGEEPATAVTDLRRAARSAPAEAASASSRPRSPFALLRRRGRIGDEPSGR